MNAVGHRGEQHDAGNQSNLCDHRRVAASLGVTADGDLRPLRLVSQQKTVPSFIGILPHEILEELGESVVDAVCGVDIQKGHAIDPVNDLEAGVLVAGAGIRRSRARFR